jgi:hypothetical protein
MKSSPKKKKKTTPPASDRRPPKTKVQAIVRYMKPRACHPVKAFVHLYMSRLGPTGRLCIFFPSPSTVPHIAIMSFLTHPPDRNLDQAGMAAGHGQDAPSPKNKLSDTRKISNEESGTDLDESDAILLAMGYKPEMARNRSTLQVAFMSFVLASIPYGLATTFYYPLVGGGPANIIWGWILVSLIIICVAASLGEITSVYPTAGGVYYQTFMLAPAKYKRVLSWICGWAYVVGNITITLAVNFGSALFIISCVNVFESSPGVGIWEASAWETWLVFVAITLFCNLVSSLGNRLLALIDVRQFFPHRPTVMLTF